MAKKQTESSIITANIATAAAAALQKEKAIISAKRAPAVKKQPKAKVAEVFVEKAKEQPVGIEEIVAAQAISIASQKPAPERAKIAELAYLYWEARGYQGGHEEEVQDWLSAEAQLQA